MSSIAFFVKSIAAVVALTLFGGCAIGNAVFAADAPAVATTVDGAITTPASADPVAFAAGGPGGVLDATPHSQIDTEIRVTNESTNEATFNLEVVSLLPLDDGKLELTDQKNPFTDGVNIVNSVVVPARTTKKVQTKITVPDSVASDTYFVGIAVSANPTTKGTAQVLRIVAPITLRVASGKGATMRIDFKSPRIVWGNQVNGRYTVVNSAGSSAEVARTMNLNVVGSKSIPVAQVGSPTELMLAGHRKSFSWNANVRAAQFGLVRPHVNLEYSDDSNAKVNNSYLGGWILVMTPLTIAMAVVVLLLVLCGAWFLIRALRARNREKKAISDPVEV